MASSLGVVRGLRFGSFYGKECDRSDVLTMDQITDRPGTDLIDPVPGVIVISGDPSAGIFLDHHRMDPEGRF